MINRNASNDNGRGATGERITRRAVAARKLANGTIEDAFSRIQGGLTGAAGQGGGGRSGGAYGGGNDGSDKSSIINNGTDGCNKSNAANSGTAHAHAPDPGASPVRPSSARRLFDILEDPGSVFRPQTRFCPQAAASVGSGSEGNPAANPMLVHPSRIRVVKSLDLVDDLPVDGPVIYMMFRDQRTRDNWALLHAAEEAKRRNAPLAVVFTALSSLLGAAARQYDFMFRGLREVAKDLEAMGIPFFFFKGRPSETTASLARRTKASLLVCDYSPIRIFHQWIEEMMCPPSYASENDGAEDGAEDGGENRPRLSTTFKSTRVAAEIRIVDAHNVVPVWVASVKREVGARTIRPKIHRALPEFMHEFPEMPLVREWNLDVLPDRVNWTALLREYHEAGKHVPPVHWIKPGEAEARGALLNPRTGFLSDERIKMYDTLRNDPSRDAVSNLSPYLHFGQLAPQRAAMEASKLRKAHPSAVDSFLEELVVRRELADNFCHYTIDAYDSLSSAAGWAQETLEKHRSDPREHVYSRATLESGRTSDELWNACQLQMTRLGKMHGFMRMYWAKKVLEWTRTPEEALKILIDMNDIYEIDGRDPNGYVGIMWSVAGIHDQGWGERAVFGKIRYMNYAGCKRKFNIPAYCASVQKAIAREEKAAAAAAAAAAATAGEPDDVWVFDTSRRTVASSSVSSAGETAVKMEDANIAGAIKEEEKRPEIVIKREKEAEEDEEEDCRVEAHPVKQEREEEEDVTALRNTVDRAKGAKRSRGIAVDGDGGHVDEQDVLKRNRRR